MTAKRKVFVVSGPDGYLYSDFVAVEFPEELFYRFSNYSTEKVRRNTRDGYRVVEFEEVVKDVENPTISEDYAEQLKQTFREPETFKREYLADWITKEEVKEEE